MWAEIAKLFQAGDPYVYTIFALAFFGCMIFFERMIMLQFVYNMDFRKFLDNLKKSVRAEDMDRAVDVCKSASKTSLPLIGLRALEAAEVDPSTVRGTIEEEAMEFIPRLESRLGILPALATLVLFTGVLGTIDTLWHTFHAIDVLDTSQKQAVFGSQISSSLGYTTLGLAICMFFLLAHHLVRGMAFKLVEKFHHGIAVITNLLAPADVAVVPAMAGVAPRVSAPAPSNVADAPPEVADAPPPAEAPAAEVAAAAPAEPQASAPVEDIKDEEEII